jgi:hypothetical protein
MLNPFRHWTAQAHCTGERVRFYVFGGREAAKRKAKRIMRQKGWTGFRLLHSVRW